MASFPAHVDQADRNAEFLKACNTYFNAQFIEWIVVVRFYICLHIVEAIFATHGRDLKSHSERTKVMPMFVGNLYDRDFSDHYMDLYQLSCHARYATNISDPLTPRDISDSEIHFNYIITFAKNKYKIVLSNLTYP
jgi:hypothetical protein